MKRNIKNILLGCTLLIFMSSCVKENFDNTPEYVTELEANMSIADLKAKYANMPAMIDTDIVIKGVVISNDENGNFYKELFIQDESTGIGIELNSSRLHEKYPAGKMVFVKCKGLAIGLDYDVPKIGMTLGINAINRALIEDYLDVSTGGTPANPTLINLADAVGNKLDSLIGSFVRIENVKFKNPGSIYAQEGSAYTTLELSDSLGKKIELSTSSHASFAKDTVPDGEVNIDAVLSKFSGKYQLRINSSNNVKPAAMP